MPQVGHSLLCHARSRPYEPTCIKHSEHDGHEQRAGEEGEQHEGGGDEEARPRRRICRAAQRGGGPCGGGAPARA
jgi:hypothetical protein